MEIDKIRKWLLLVARNFQIKNVYHFWNPDKSLKGQQEYITFEIVSSAPADQKEIIDKELSGTRDVKYKISKAWETTVRVTAHSARGMYFLQALSATRYMPKIIEFFGPEIKSFDCDSISFAGFEDMSVQDFEYEANFIFHERVGYELSEENMVFDEINLSYKIKAEEDKEIVFTTQTPEEAE